jgi:hypothetical protein
MRTFIYVAGLVDDADDFKPGEVGFVHTTLEAEDENDAYTLGVAWLDQHDATRHMNVVGEYVFEPSQKVGGLKEMAQHFNPRRRQAQLRRQTA